MELRPFQTETLALLEKHRHVLCIAPTGAGKGTLAEVAAQRFAKKTLVITPLVALGRQQLERFSKSGLHAVHRGTKPPAQSSGQSMGKAPGVWILSPESLTIPAVQQNLMNWGPDLLIVDECHCIDLWGKNFRPAFNWIPQLCNELSTQGARSLWLTATLTASALDGLITQLDTKPVCKGTFEVPPQLTLRKIRCDWLDRLEFLVRLSQETAEPGLIYCPTRESTVRLRRALEQRIGLRMASYHAGLSQEERMLIELNLNNGRIDWTLSTSAFGLGMDYRQLRWCVVFEPPRDIVDIAQFVGRVCRDLSSPSRAWILWQENELYRNTISNDIPTLPSRRSMQVEEFLRSNGDPRAVLTQFFC